MDIVRCIPETKGDGSRPLPSRRVHSCSSKLAIPRCGLRAVRTRAALWLTRLVAGRGFGNVFSDLHRECSSVFQIWVGSCQVAQGGTAMLMSPGCTRCVPRMASILRTTASAFDTSVRCHPGPHIRQDCCSGFRLLNLQVAQAIYEPLIAALGSLTLSLCLSRSLSLLEKEPSSARDVGNPRRSSTSGTSWMCLGPNSSHDSSCFSMCAGMHVSVQPNNLRACLQCMNA